MGSIEPGNVLEALRERLAAVAGDDVDLTLVVSPSAEGVQFDAPWIEALLLGFAVGARDGLGGRGGLTIEVSLGRQEGHPAGPLGGVGPGSHVRIEASYSSTRGGNWERWRPIRLQSLVRQKGGDLLISRTSEGGLAIQVFLPWDTCAS